MTIDLLLGDCLEVMKTLDDDSVDTIITDPPYELGFMGKKWDSSGVAFQVETWKAVYRVLKPGAIMLAFGGTRTYHRMVCAIEDAGFEIRDTIAWVYGSGFPKSYNIGKGIEAQMKTGRSSPKGQRMVAMGDEYEQTPLAGTPNYGVTGNFTNKDTGSKPMAITTPAAQLWHGYGTALKPAFEPIVVAMKPIDGTFVNNALTWGVAGLWIDGGRVGTEKRANPQAGFIRRGRTDEEVFGGVDRYKPDGELAVTGRFPANVIHDGSDEVLRGFPNDTQRFFYCAKASRSERNAGLEGMPERDGGHYAQDEWSRKNMGNKPDAERKPVQNHHPTVKPIALMEYLVRLTKTPTGGVVLDPFMGSGTTGIACVNEGRDFIGIEQSPEYHEIAQRRIEYAQLQLKVELPLLELIEDAND